MILRSAFISLPILAATQGAFAEVPNVLTDMAPVQSLVQQVMGDLASPVALMPAGASPHGYALSPSDAKALQSADIVFWTGSRIEPWLDEMIDKVAGHARSVPLAEVEGATVLALREGATFERHIHDDEGDEHAEEHADDHGEEQADAHDEHSDEHDDHAEEHGDAQDAETMAHDDEHDHDEVGHDEHDHDDHDLSGTDGHAWLDPMNGRLWLGVIAETLSEADPENADSYRANAAAAQAELDQVIARIEGELAPISDMRFIVFHDAYNYFENRFGLAAAGAISLSDASAPSPARIREIQDTIKAQQVTCVFSEPQFNPGMVKTVLDGTEARTEVIDPMGAALEPGAGFYTALMEEISGAFLACAGK
ncbi:zinc ABC transporter substrate-binding protein [Celeribacter neptunius]|uniref:High-affinity zinc uptake system protein ZnuA n=1 Tax=Celeribacter neptunius TaxID=588602 RepID=A0A1I3UH69_9RHOB|nr:zinc ABC transporter substrate-binding protein [Celeribacter neptunius]SFJ82400.1 zinc transport system substrate-binding protein [Celeribacter neptunius]